MSDFLNFLLGQLAHQLGPHQVQGTSGTTTLVADDPNEPIQVVNAKALVLIYNPLMDPEGGKSLSVYQSWSDPDEMVGVFINDLLQASNGLVRYQVAERILVNEFPPLADGFTFTPQIFLDVYNGKTPAHAPATVDYNAILKRFNILQRVADNEIDEVWVMGFPYAGFYESIMGGAGAYWCNAPALAGTAGCPRKFIVMGFSYERTVGEMLHSYAHRCESIMANVYNSLGFLTWAYQPNRVPAMLSPTQPLNLFERFLCFDAIAPGRAAIGTVHCAPNSAKDYDYGSQTPARSECYDWLNFPNFKGDVRTVTAAEWGGGDDGAYQMWWLSHMPKVAGRLHGILNNWWHYVGNPNNI
jgi:hypothetical protein